MASIELKRWQKNNFALRRAGRMPGPCSLPNLDTYQRLALAIMSMREWLHDRPTASRVVLLTAPVIWLGWSSPQVIEAGLDDLCYLRPQRGPDGEPVPLSPLARRRPCIVNAPHQCAGLLDFLAQPGELVALLVQDANIDTLVEMGLSGEFRRRRFPDGLVAIGEVSDQGFE